MGRTCGEPDEIELTPMGVKLNGSRRVHLKQRIECGQNEAATHLLLHGHVCVCRSWYLQAATGQQHVAMLMESDREHTSHALHDISPFHLNFVGGRGRARRGKKAKAARAKHKKRPEPQELNVLAF